jgi:hypothetical protein
MKSKLHRSLIVMAMLALSTLNSELSTAHAQGTTFTYQGQLMDAGAPANGLYDIRAGLYTTSSGGSLIGRLDTNTGVAVSKGLFTVPWDFGGGVLDGTAYWLELGVRTNAGTDFATLSPRQELTPAPYAVFAQGSSNVLGVVPSGGLSGAYSGAVTFNNVSDSFRGAFTGNGGGLTNVDAATLGGLSPANFCQLGANNVLGSNETNFFAANSNLLNHSVSGGGTNGVTSVNGQTGAITNVLTNNNVGAIQFLNTLQLISTTPKIHPFDILGTNGGLLLGAPTESDGETRPTLWSLNSQDMVQIGDSFGGVNMGTGYDTSAVRLMGTNTWVDGNLTLTLPTSRLIAPLIYVGGVGQYAVLSSRTSGGHGYTQFQTVDQSNILQIGGLAGTYNAEIDLNATNTVVSGILTANASGLTGGANISVATATNAITAAKLVSGATTTNVFNANGTGSGNIDTNLTVTGATFTSTAALNTNTGNLGVAGSAVISGQLAIGSTGGGVLTNPASITLWTPIVTNTGDTIIDSNLNSANLLTGGVLNTNGYTNTFPNSGKFSVTNWIAGTNHYAYDFTNTVAGSGTTTFYTNSYRSPCYYLVNVWVTAVCRTNIHANYSQGCAYWVTNTAAGCAYETHSATAGVGASTYAQRGTIAPSPANTAGWGLYWNNGSGATNTMSVIVHVDVYLP